MCTQATAYFPSLRAVVCIGDGIYLRLYEKHLACGIFFKKSFASCSLYSTSYLPCLQTVHPIVHAVSYFLRGMQGDLENICHCLEHTEWLAYFSHNSEVPALKLSSGLFVHGSHMEVSFKTLNCPVIWLGVCVYAPCHFLASALLCSSAMFNNNNPNNNNKRFLRARTCRWIQEVLCLTWADAKAAVIVSLCYFRTFFMEGWPRPKEKKKGSFHPLSTLSLQPYCASNPIPFKSVASLELLFMTVCHWEIQRDIALSLTWGGFREELIHFSSRYFGPHHEKFTIGDLKCVQRHK